MSVNFLQLGEAMQEVLAQPLQDIKVALQVFPDGDFEKQGRAYKRSNVICSLASQSWLAPANSASLSRIGQAQQSSSIALQFYITSFSLVSNDGIFPVKELIEQKLSGRQLIKPYGMLYPQSFTFANLTSNCQWQYEFTWSLDLLTAQKGKQPMATIQAFP